MFIIIFQENGFMRVGGNTEEESSSGCSSHDDWDCCTSSNQCGVNEGDCDSDSECMDGLVCGNNNCPAGAPDSFDCCTEVAVILDDGVTSFDHHGGDSFVAPRGATVCV